MAQYFYDEQLKKWLLQFMKIFSGWNVTFGNDPQGNPILHSVPVQYGDLSRQVATVIANNSPSQLPAVPFISIYISGLEYDQKRTQDPTFLDNSVIRQRTINPDTGQYEQTQGQAFTVKRLMPVPYNLRFTVDIWTSNYKQKLEIMEQLGILFNPSLELQSNPNLIDWTSLSVVYQDGLTWTSRTVPQGTSNPIDILSWKFYTPVWISAPVKVEKLGIIQKIIASIYRGSALEDTQNEDLLLGQRQVVTPYGYKVLLVGQDLQLLPNNQTENPPNTDIESIASVLISGVDTNSNGFTFYTQDPCLDVAVGQWVQFSGIVDYPTITDIATQFVGTSLAGPGRAPNSDKIIDVSSATNAVITTQEPHGLTTGDNVNIAGVVLFSPSGGTLPIINGNQVVTVLTDSTFSVVVDTSDVVFNRVASNNPKIMTLVTAITLSVSQPNIVAGIQADFLTKLNPATNLYWKAYLNVFGTVRPGISLIKLQNPNLATEIVGTINYNPGDDRLLSFTIDPDTLPTNTIPEVLSVIDPLQKYPNTPMNMNGSLPVANTGDRYLIVNNIGTNNTAKLYTKSNTTANAGSTFIYIEESFDFDPANYVGATVFARTPHPDNKPIFSTGTTVNNIIKMGSDWVLQLSTGILNGFAGYEVPLEIETSAQITNPAWDGLVANANDIIEYGDYDIQQTANGQKYFIDAPSNVLNLYSTANIKVGSAVSIGGVNFGTVIGFTDAGVILSQMITRDVAADATVDFRNTGWFVIFDSTGARTIGGVNAAQVQFVTNLTTGIQYLWSNGAWVKSYEGWYDAGDWSIVI